MFWWEKESEAVGKEIKQQQILLISNTLGTGHKGGILMGKVICFCKLSESCWLQNLPSFHAKVDSSFGLNNLDDVNHKTGIPYCHAQVTDLTGTS